MFLKRCKSKFLTAIYEVFYTLISEKELDCMALSSAG